MKVFISADIEGTAITATREGCRPGEFEYERSRREMTAEVVAAAEGARAAGALTQTSALRGCMRSDAKTRAEVMALLGGR